jgi:hypothetical protein
MNSRLSPSQSTMDRNSIKSQLDLLKQRLSDPNNQVTASDLLILQGLIDQLSINEQLATSISPSSSIMVPSVTNISRTEDDSSLTTADPPSSAITPNQEHASISALTATSSPSIFMNFANTSNINGSVSYLMTSIGGGMQGNFPFVWNPKPNNSLSSPVVITDNPSNYITTTNVDFTKTRLAVDGDISTNGTLNLTPGSGGIVCSNPRGVKFDGEWGNMKFQGGDASNAWLVASSTGGPALFQVFNQTGNVDIKGYARGPNMCKAFVSFDGSDYLAGNNYCRMHSQYNIKNVVRLSVGRYVVNFEKKFDDNLYTPVVSVIKNNGTDDTNMLITIGSTDRAPTDSSCPISIGYFSLIPQDSKKITMIVYHTPYTSGYTNRVSATNYSVTCTSTIIQANFQLAYFRSSVQCQLQISGIIHPIVVTVGGPQTGEVITRSIGINRAIYPNINSSTICALILTEPDGTVQTLTTNPIMS